MAEYAKNRVVDRTEEMVRGVQSLEHLVMETVLTSAIVPCSSSNYQLGREEMKRFTSVLSSLLPEQTQGDL